MESGDWKALIQAIIDQDLEKVDYYLKMDFDPDFLHPEMMTSPLIEAVRIENMGIIKQLLLKGASPKLVSQLGESAIQIARNNKNKTLIRLLKRY